jgi:hypothetical protein
MREFPAHAATKDSSLFWSPIIMGIDPVKSLIVAVIALKREQSRNMHAGTWSDTEKDSSRQVFSDDMGSTGTNHSNSRPYHFHRHAGANRAA